jgi:D-alanyl-lipoteichoic acid acyltransferase DltB (MBOAT superfamily)
MFFTDIPFFIFLPTVVLLYWVLPLRGQNLLLLVASYIFYAWAVPWTVFLMLGTTVIHFIAALWIERLRASRPDSDRMRGVLIAAAVISLTVLSWFKYTNFVLANLALIFPGLPMHVAILLPAGVSFFTFHALAYTIDVYRGEFKAERSFVDFAVFMAFFPQLVAGPISRASNLLTQVTMKRAAAVSQMVAGIDLLFLGYVKKLVIADNVAVYVNMIFDLKSPSIMMLFVGGIGFSIQILADFSSYTDIARGCAKLLGFELIENFDKPYLSTSPSEFWRRWHMSLSSCIRDYIYFPLGGSKVSTPRWIVNVLFTWLLCGLWHGAGWNFIAWGLYWGVLLIVYRFVTIIPDGRLSFVARLPVMFFWIVCGWILFRTKDLSLFGGYLQQSFLGPNFAYLCVLRMTLYVFLLYSIPLIVVRGLKESAWVVSVAKRYPMPLRVLAYGVAILLLVVFSAEQSADFYYFQF